MANVIGEARKRAGCRGAPTRVTARLFCRRSAASNIGLTALGVIPWSPVPTFRPAMARARSGGVSAHVCQHYRLDFVAEAAVFWGLIRAGKCLGEGQVVGARKGPFQRALPDREPGISSPFLHRRLRIPGFLRELPSARPTLPR